MADSPFVVDVTADNFSQVVLEGSQERPVLVDFWAEWCAPCRALAPVLAKIAADQQGRLLVAKVNTEEQQAIAAQFAIRSLPTVKLFRHGQVVDEFMGALPESDVRLFLDRHLPRESDSLLVKAQALLDQGAVDQAAALVDQAAASDPDNPNTLGLLARIDLARGDYDAAETRLNALPLDAQGRSETGVLRAQLAFRRVVATAPPVDELKRRLDANPRDSDALYGLAAHKALAGDYETALDLLLTLLRSDRGYGDDAARKGMVQVFELLGGSGELVSRYRAKMTSALF